MKTLLKRVATLEEQSVDRRPYVVWQDMDGTIQKPIPHDIGDRPVHIYRWATEEDEAVLDPSRMALGSKEIGKQA